MKYLLNFFLLFFINQSYGVSFSSPYELEAPRAEEVKWLNGLRLFSPSSPNGADTSKRPIFSATDDFTMLLKVFPGISDKVVSALEIDARGLSEAALDQEVWSYHSFPVHRGGLADRFTDNSFNSLSNWSERYEQYQRNLPQEVIDDGRVKYLSPIEKYELLIGNTEFELTKKQWQEGLDAMNRYGEVPTWFGSCHGTAPASVKHIRPSKSIAVPSYNGAEDIIFYPSDIKALLAFAWATQGGPSAIIGTRCNSDGDIISRSCYDTNPGAFHLALTNLVGLHKKPFIIDTTSGVQIWNRPIVKYELKYFNPQTGYYTRKIDYSLVPVEKFTNDRFKKFRTKGYKKALGVRASVTFVSDTEPSADNTDSPTNDRYTTFHFVYDLELDANDNILGGMWHDRWFPDFAWVVADDMLPLTREDRLLDSDIIIYDGKKPIPTYLQQLAKSSSKRGQISFRVIDLLLNLAK